MLLRSALLLPPSYRSSILVINILSIRPLCLAAICLKSRLPFCVRCPRLLWIPLSKHFIPSCSSSDASQPIGNLLAFLRNESGLGPWIQYSTSQPTFPGHPLFSKHGGYLRYPPPSRPLRLIFINPLYLHIHFRN